jgi:hypothetical protein
MATRPHKVRSLIDEFLPDRNKRDLRNPRRGLSFQNEGTDAENDKIYRRLQHRRNVLTFLQSEQPRRAAT